ncbi:MAG: CoA-binding protein [Clostridia bacterium]|nr:MAG: CoA-binding protein [Clostridia bacterium]
MQRTVDFARIKNIAVVGLSDKPERASYRVAAYLQQAGYRIIPVNPSLTRVLGEKCYPNLEAVPEDISVDVVDIFRRSEDVPPIVETAIKRGVPVIWMQEGVVNEEAAAAAAAAGRVVVMDKCLMQEHQRARVRGG